MGNQRIACSVQKMIQNTKKIASLKECAGQNKAQEVKVMPAATK